MRLIKYGSSACDSQFSGHLISCYKLLITVYFLHSLFIL